MQLRFGPDDLDTFAEVKRQLLLDEFRPWAEQHYGADDGSLVADADTFLSWRVNYSSGDLARFSPDEAEEFLLDWVPRTFAVGPDEAPVLCRAVQALVEFLAATGRLTGGEAAAARVMMHVDGLVDDLAEALADDRNFGLGKSLAGVALSDRDGNPLPDLEALLRDGDLDLEQLQAVLDERMEAFNSLPFEERRAHTDRAFGLREPDPVELPFTYVPPLAEDVERSAADSTLLRLVDRFAEFVATDGVKLTDTGNIKLADARRLVEVLGTGDVLDRSLLGRPVKTRTSTELRWLTVVDHVASYCGAVRRLRTKLAPSPVWAELPVLDRAALMTRGLLEVGPLGSRFAHWDDIDLAHRALLDDGIPHWLTRVLPEGSRLDYAEVEELAVMVTEERFAGVGGGFLSAAVPSRLTELFEVLELAGLITWHDRVEAPDPYGISTRLVSGEISLTPLGRFTMAEPVRDAGYTFATIDDLADADGLTVVNAIATGSLDKERALELWQPNSSTAQRARLIADAAVEAGISEQRLVAFDFLGQLEPLSAVGPVVRELLDTHCSGHAATFLLEHGLASTDEVGMFIDVGPLIDMLHTIIDEPAELDRLFRHVHAAALGDLLDDLWRHDQPETIELLEALGRHVTDKPLAKQARKAAIKHRSWLANQGR